ncbi:hypothetical protein AIOGIFDO_00715 [Candidatus Methanoperedenaceae archaeon GB37]|nr:hypothetical protein AIOGIFDO_00715 [Candidatus Methanoperedenaceae archaeon GB37]
MGECKRCMGSGVVVEDEKTCPECHGSGRVKSVNLTSLREEDLAEIIAGDATCRSCGGKGKIVIKKKCEVCDGTGLLMECRICGGISTSEICESCREKPIVWKLRPACDISDLEAEKTYEGVVGDVVNFGAFVQLNSSVKGLLHSSKLKQSLKSGDKIFVKVCKIQPNGNIELAPVSVSDHRLIEVKKKLPRRRTDEISDFVGKQVMVSGEVIQVKQTGGPTIFTISDEFGMVHSAAFERAGERAYPEIESEMIVEVIGEVNLRNGEIQIEVMEINQLHGSSAREIKKEIDASIRRRAEPVNQEFLVKSQILEKLRPAMLKVAEEIKYAVLTSRPIIIRHHADADGITSAVAIERAILPLIREVGGNDAEYHFFKRSPSKAPFYEIQDITKDLTFALEDAARFGQKLPLILLMDNGSTEEDVPALLQAEAYGLDVIVVDHHHPDEVVDQYLLAHVNPAHAGGDFGITTGMLGFEIARMIRPEVGEEILHFPAISAVGDRSEAPEADAYIELVAERYTREELTEIALALDYESYWQRFSDGRGIINDILNLGNPNRHRRIIEILSKQARTAIEEQLRATLPNVRSITLPNGVLLNVIDVEKYAHKFTFPPPGKTSGEIHDHYCKEHEGRPIVTIGYGPDFAVIRSKGVLLNIPEMVRELRDEIVGAGVTGGGHLVVGSIKFVEGKRRDVLERLAEKIGAART